MNAPKRIAPPACVCGCRRPVMPNSPFYFLCKMIKDGWNESTREYEEIVPFAHPTGDEGEVTAKEATLVQPVKPVSPTACIACDDKEREVDSVLCWSCQQSGKEEDDAETIPFEEGVGDHEHWSDEIEALK